MIRGQWSLIDSWWTPNDINKEDDFVKLDEIEMYQCVLEMNTQIVTGSTVDMNTFTQFMMLHQYNS